MPATISLYQLDADPERGPEWQSGPLGEWLDMNEFSSEELNEVLTAFSEGRLYHGGGGASPAWAVKLYEPFDEKLDPWSDQVPEHAYA